MELFEMKKKCKDKDLIWRFNKDIMVGEMAKR